jgi:hypothetical protein
MSSVRSELTLWGLTLMQLEYSIRDGESISIPVHNKETLEVASVLNNNDMSWHVYERAMNALIALDKKSLRTSSMKYDITTLIEARRRVHNMTRSTLEDFKKEYPNNSIADYFSKVVDGVINQAIIVIIDNMIEEK